MPKKVPPEKVTAVIMSYATTHSGRETSRQTGVPEATVRKILKDNKDDPYYARVYAKKQEDFVAKADRIIDKALDRLEKQLDGDDYIPVNNLSTVIGTMYDKRALAKGDPTSNEVTTIRVELTDE